MPGCKSCCAFCRIRAWPSRARSRSNAAGRRVLARRFVYLSQAVARSVCRRTMCPTLQEESASDRCEAGPSSSLLSLLSSPLLSSTLLSSPRSVPPSCNRHTALPFHPMTLAINRFGMTSVIACGLVTFLACLPLDVQAAPGSGLRSLAKEARSLRPLPIAVDASRTRRRRDAQSQVPCATMVEDPERNDNCCPASRVYTPSGESAQCCEYSQRHEAVIGGRCLRHSVCDRCRPVQQGSQ